jgi:hypothetical protein
LLILNCNPREEKMKKRASNKIQTPEMEKDIERTKDISEAWLQGGKAIGEIVRPMKKKSRTK